MKRATFWAHSVEGQPREAWQTLEEHLRAVAERAAAFAAAFDSAEWGRLAGLWHDLGKYCEGFQKRLEGAAEGVDHAGAGAALAVAKDGRLGLPLAFCIAGHHGGLPNGKQWKPGAPRPLAERVQEARQALEEARANAPRAITEAALPPLPALFRPAGSREDRTDLLLARRRLAFWIRFLYAALVDADFLDTEAFYRPGVRESATAGYADIPTLRARLDRYLAERFGGAGRPPSTGPVARSWRPAAARPSACPASSP